MATREFSIAEDSAFVLEPLCERADFTLYRGRERGKETPILAVAVAAAQLSSQGVRKLKHEFSLATELDAAWAAQPLTLTNYQGRTVLILKDPGGEPLDLVIERNQSQPIDLTRFLRIAIGLAQALDQVHRQGLVHKDVKPANAFVDDFGHVWLTGFAIASRLPRERLAPAPLEFIDGTFAYMSPEQTGRMNRSVDSRSDLYSLGVTLYQMLTGVLPFTAADPLEWVHCHIARQPLTPAERGAVPDMLSAIIMRLLAKNAEERYQAATGLEADLRRCLNEWQTHGHIEPFSIGADDSSDRLLIPEKLYGREREVDSLLATFDRVVQGGKPELVLVSGHPGVGKSAVVNELHKWLVPPRGLYASGKFDQYKRDIPFATLAQAFQSLIRPLLSKPEVELSKWRDDLHSALSPNGALLVDLVPELKLIIGEQPPLTALPAQEAKTRAYLALRRFLGVFARPEHPLALFLDDLQWLDPATLDFLEDLLVQQDLAHLLVVELHHLCRREAGTANVAGDTIHAEEAVVGAVIGQQDFEQGNAAAVGRVTVADAGAVGMSQTLPVALALRSATGAGCVVLGSVGQNGQFLVKVHHPGEDDSRRGGLQGAVREFAPGLIIAKKRGRLRQGWDYSLISLPARACLYLKTKENARNFFAYHPQRTGCPGCACGAPHALKMTGAR